MTQFTKAETTYKGLNVQLSRIRNPKFTLVVPPNEFDTITVDDFVLSNSLYPFITFEQIKKSIVDEQFVAKFKDRSNPNSELEDCIIDKDFGDWIIVEAPLWFWAKIYKFDLDALNFKENNNKRVTALWLTLQQWNNSSNN